jgi:hypothetical protein
MCLTVGRGCLESIYAKASHCTDLDFVSSKKGGSRLLLVLAVIGGVLTLLSLVAHKSAWPSSALLNYGSGIVTSVLLIYLYDESHAKRAKTEKDERERRVARSLKVVVRQHYRVLLDCYRSATTETTSPEFTSVNEFLGLRFHETAKHLDLYSPSPMSSDGRTPYFDYIEQSFKAFQNLLQQALHYHALDLREGFAAAIEDLLDSPMLKVSVNLSLICNFTPPGFPPRMMQFDNMERNIADYCLKFCRFLNVMETVEPQGLRDYRIGDWHNDIFPYGHARRKPPAGSAQP